MGKEKALKKAGIEVVRKLSEIEINKIAINISDEICSSFPEYNINKTDLFNSLSKINMFLANFKDNSAAKYYYKDDSIYFKEDIDFENLNTPALHECLHFIQSIKNKKGKLLRLGLYDLTKFRTTGLAINEAAVQLMASYATLSKTDTVKYYGMELITDSPNYYPIECTLVKQMTYFTGTYPLFHSTLYSNDIFKNTFIMKSDEKTYEQIITNLDLIVEYEEALHKENLYLSYIEYNNKSSSIKVANSQRAIENLKKDIKELTLKTQELILTSCAYSELELVRDNQTASLFKEKLYNFKNLLIQADGYSFYNDFYCNMMEKLDVKRELIKKYGTLNCFTDIKENVSLIETRKEPLNLFKVTIEKLKKLFHINQEQTENQIETGKK